MAIPWPCCAASPLLWRSAYHTIAKQLNELGVPTKRRGEFMNLLNGGTTTGIPLAWSSAARIFATAICRSMGSRRHLGKGTTRPLLPLA